MMLDEQAFQGLLAAAFTIQEHNDKRLRETADEPAAGLQLSSPCPHCGAAKLASETVCATCGRGEFRPGERLQRNWASMWLMSQDRGFWPERSADNDGGMPGNAESPAAISATQALRDRESDGTGSRSTPSATAAMPTDTSNRPGHAADYDSLLFKTRGAKSSFSDSSFGESSFKRSTFGAAGFGKTSVGDSSGGERAQDNAQAEIAWPRNATGDLGFEDFRRDRSRRDNASRDDLGRDDLGQNDGAMFQPGELSSNEDFSPGEATNEEPSEATNDASFGPTTDDRPISKIQRLADWRVILRFHRADLYLAVAVVVALAGLLWPAAVAPRRTGLGPFQRAMVKLGLAEAPAPPVVHLLGDPGVEVWVDPHTALYYCPGAEQYGKTADGYVANQRDAQMDRFGPARRSPCE